MNKKDPGPLPEMKWLPKTAFVVDHHYQRSAESDRSRAVIGRIAQNFMWSRFQPPTVTPGPKGTYIVIDGQHRVKAALRRTDIDRLPAYIVPNLSLQDQATNFVAINRDRVALHALQLHHALLAMGDKEALRIKEVCDEAGISIVRQPAPGGNTKPHETAAIGAIKTGIAAYGEAIVIAALMIIPEAYKLTPGMMRARTLKALMAFFKGRGIKFVDRDALIRAMKKNDPILMEDRALARSHKTGESAHLSLLGMISKAYEAELK